MNSTQETQLSHELRQLVSDQPFTPDTQALGLRARQRHRRVLALRGATAAGAAILLAAGGVFAAVHGTGGGAAGTTASRPPAVGSRLVTLAATIRAGDGNLPGNASLVMQTQTLNQGPPEITYNLYTDSGLYYGAASKTGLRAAVAHHENLSGMYARPVVAAARYAATGDLTAARARMVNATPNDLGLGLSPAARKRIWDNAIAKDRQILRAKGIKVNPSANPPAGKTLQRDMDNDIWFNSYFALAEGAGNAQVREGVLRLVSTIPEVTVANSITGGRPTLTLTAGPALNPGSGLPAQVVTISARTGMPVSSVWGTPGQKYYSSDTFQVSRVMLADIKAGRF